jgi:EAL domain-containing protein (putative c-di-GMP-specific phosphodiesterase class I)
MGVQIAIDDFGVGYSSLSYLKRFPVSTLKIDRSFVKDITTDEDNAAITIAIIAMAHSLRLTVIAEGIEDAQQLALLRSQHCEIAQGYLFSPPIPAEDITELLSKPNHLAIKLNESIESDVLY